MTGCSTAEQSSPTYHERGYPTAPPQQIPDAADGQAEPVTAVPIAELPDPAWLERTAERTDIPERVLAAYAGASLHLAQTDPGCGLGWNTLAGIGAVESVHGSYGGARIDDNGVVAPRIIGVPLDGGDDVMAIPDTDGGELDGDAEWDRAVGPMQFIPTTWRQYAEDGNLDGDADPHQIDDAVLTAAVYLCEGSGDLTDDEGWNAAITAYNQSLAYAREVADRAEAYAG